MTRLLLASSALALIAGAAQAETVLHILHTNDLHSRIEPITASGNTCGAEAREAGECFGGVARIAAAVAQMRAEIEAAGEHVLLLDAGDQYQGSLFYTTYKGEEVVEFMNAIGYDAMVIGNHEFDDGPEGLNVLLEGADFPVIAGNIDVSQSNLLAGRIPGHVVLEAGPMRVGIVSALAMDTPDTSSPGPNVIFRDDIDSLKEGVEQLSDEGVTSVIALTHSGYLREMDYAAEVSGLSAVVGGHSHTLLGDMEGAAGPYPTFVTDPDGVEVPVVQTNGYGMYLGHLVLTFDDEGQLLRAEGQPILLDATMPEDEAILARVAEMSGPIDELRATVVAQALAPIDGSRETCRAQECEMGNLVADAMLARAEGQGVSIVIQNGGGLRASLDAGEVTMGDVYSVLPFQNTLATFELDGADVIAALENGASRLEDGAGRFAQVAGLQYTLDASAEPGSRISNVMVRQDGEWSPIDPDASYSVATNNYMRSGGDGYDVFAERGRNAYDFGPDLAEVVADYMAEAEGGYQPILDGRITLQ